METTWENLPQEELESLSLTLSDSTTKNYRKSKNVNIVKSLLTVLRKTFNLLFTATAILGWIIFFTILFDAFFLKARIIEFILVGS